MALGRSFETKLDFVRPEHTDLRGREFNPNGRALPEKQQLRERVFVSQPFTIEDARQAPGGIESFELDTHGFAYMRGLPPWPAVLANPKDYDFPDW